MNTTDCACDRFARLEGAATQAYISQFLERTAVDEEEGRTHYICRICGRPWVRIESEDQRKPSLIRQEMEFNV
jgi:hypothetical protein